MTPLATSTPAAFRPPALAPAEVMLCNMICTRRAPWVLTLGTTPCTLRPTPLAPALVPACRVTVSLGGAPWTVDIGSEALLAFHPALATVADMQALPRPVREAALELLILPLAQALTSLTGIQADPGAIVFPDEGTPLSPGGHGALRLTCTAPEGEAAAIPIPIHIYPPDADAVRTLVPALAALPARDKDSLERSPSLAELPVAFSIIAGRMPLRLSEANSLEPGDTLLPETYPAANGALTVSIPLRSGEWEATASLDGRRVTLTDTFMTCPTKEAPPMPESTQPDDAAQPQAPADAAPATPKAVPGTVPERGELEVILSFELERRTLAVRDVASLVPGYTFMLDADPLGPVTLRINGKAVGTGRLVDVNGMLGVQVTDSMA